MTRPYPNYRRSTVDWIGAVPERWGVRSLGYSLDACVGGGTPSTSREECWADEWDEGVPWVAIADMSTGGTVAATQKRVTPLGLVEKRLQLLPVGTVVYSMYASVGAVARLGMPAVTNQAILGLIPDNTLTSPFLYWWLHACRNAVLALVRSNTQSNLNAETVRRLPLALPPLPEQQAIAAFLDRRTADIDVLIERNRLLVERLAEYRTALVTHTVTRGLPPREAEAAGLDPDPPMRDSGVEWLGEVPEHWETCPTRRRFDIVNGGTPKSGIAEYWDGSTVWITPDDLGRNGRAWISEGRRNITENGVAKSGAHISPAGSIVLSTRAPIGHLAILAAPAATNQGCRTLVPSPAMDSRFAYCSFSASRPVIQSLGKGSTFMELPASDLGDHPIPLPPLEEQRAIAECLDRRTDEIDTLSSGVEAAIERLQEYRTALVTAAVTGKIDVRGIAPAEMEACCA